MNPKAAYKPAIKLSDGTILSGRSHTILALKALSIDIDHNLIAGNLNYMGDFFPMYPKDEDLIPDIYSEKYALEFAHSCSKGQRDACERLIPKNEFLKIVVERWDTLKRLPLTVAVKRGDNGHIYTEGSAHGAIGLNHPDLTFVKTAADTHVLSTAGFLHDDGRFLDRQQAAHVCLSLTGIVLNKEKMLSGEEWIPPLKNKEEALEFGQAMHERAKSLARQRIDAFTSLRKHPEHVEFLKIAVAEHERKMAREIHSRDRSRKR